MKISLLVLAPPHGAQAADSAWHYARAAIALGHQLERVFFYDEAVTNGNVLAVMPQDETDRVARWAALAEESGAELVLCIGSALKRGMLDSTEADRHERPAASVHPAFVVSGLGQLVDAGIRSDRLLTFGN